MADLNLQCLFNIERTRVYRHAQAQCIHQRFQATAGNGILNHQPSTTIPITPGRIHNNITLTRGKPHCHPIYFHDFLWAISIAHKGVHHNGVGIKVKHEGIPGGAGWTYTGINITNHRYIDEWINARVYVFYRNA